MPMSREVLWNKIEEKITVEGRCYGKTGDIAIPIEWLDKFSEQQIATILAGYFTENFVSKGHAVDFALHMKEGNPHADFFVPQMKFDENGELIMSKVKTVFANTYDKETDTYGYNPELPSYDRNDSDNPN